MSVSIATQWWEREAGSPYVSIAVFAGSDPDHRAHVGTLIARRNEAAEIEARLQDRRAPRPREDVPLEWFANEDEG